VSYQDVKKILGSEQLINSCSHFVVEKGGFIEDRAHKATHNHEIMRINDCLKDGHTIQVRNLENWNEAVENKARSFGYNVDVHMFISPENGTSFPMHTDVRDVHIVCISGKKHFWVGYKEGLKMVSLEAGQELYIPAGTEHRAETSGQSVILSFGVPVDYADESMSYQFPWEVNEWEERV